MKYLDPLINGGGAGIILPRRRLAF